MNVWKRLISYFPTQLPVGMTEFNDFANDIVELTGPIADKESLIWVASNEIMRMPPGQNRVSKNTFVKLLRKYAANQIAAAKVLEIREAQEAKKKAASEAAQLQQAAVTTAETPASEQKA